ncbi:TatD family deoxyribonuclease [Candidatus Poribacteria bacterium]|nr:TatD family deoxyribonuclease [Candidatus Poribacteria bacterium]MYA98364.1 TatD family deoxyribonuclease [Candidatus Poribacteria bacterium]
MFIDSHAHIQLSQFNRDRDAVLKRAHEAAVTNILVIGFDMETSLGAVALAEKHPHIYATVGMHPHDAKDLTSEILKTFRELAAHPKVIALGEMGLDYYRNLSPRPVQKAAFEEQLDLAEELQMPIVIHNRDAYMDILPILEARQGRIRGVLHCFTGDVELMHRSLAIGFHIGIGGIVTYPNAKDVQTVAKEVPENRLLIETDCPWLAPQFRRGKRNEPAYVRAVAENIAELRSTTVETIGEITTQNFNLLMGC